MPGRFSPYTPEFSPVKYVNHVGYSWKDLTSKRLLPSAFEYDKVLRLAIERGELNRNRITHIPDEKWWRKLCHAAGEKITGRYGGNLLRDRIVHFLTNRLLVEDTLQLRKDELAKQVVKEPIFLIGMPRSYKHFVAHCYARGGYTQPLRYRDTMFIGMPHEEHRREAAKKMLRNWRYIHPSMQAIRTFGPEAVDDDIALQLQTPYSIAWGLLHGMPEYLYECIQEDQQPVYEHERECLKILQWYRDGGHLSDGVERENVPIDNPVDKVIDGEKDFFEPEDMPWLIHSPLGILNARELHSSFEDMKVIWMHRALNQSIASMAGAVALHDSMYTGRVLRETARTEVGEMVLGLFSSGSEHAIDYMAEFPKNRMVHFSNRDFNRSGIRLMVKAHRMWWPDDMDTFRKNMTINGMTELRQTFRPRHDSELEMFGLHEGMVNDACRAYVFQFEEYAFESKYGIEIQNYQPIAGGADESRYGLFDRNVEDRVSSLEQMPVDGHFLQQSHIFKPTEYVFSRPKPTLKTQAPAALRQLPPK